MFKNIFCTFYLVKGNVIELELSASAPEKEEKSKKTFIELDNELQAHYDKISVLLPKLFKKIEPKKVYLCMVEIKSYDLKGQVKGETEIEMMTEKPEFYGMTVKQFLKVNSQLEKLHEKQLREEEKQDKLSKKKNKSKE